VGVGFSGDGNTGQVKGSCGVIGPADGNDSAECEEGCGKHVVERRVMIQTNRSHTIIHIAWWSKCWSDADRKCAPFYLEAYTFSWGLAKSRFYALSFPFPLYAYSDYLPLKWVRKCDKGPVFAFTLEQLSDLAWVHTYIPGPLNTLCDGLSRYPLLGLRVLAHRNHPSSHHPPRPPTRFLPGLA
jgi:hypothetical protein